MTSVASWFRFDRTAIAINLIRTECKKTKQNQENQKQNKKQSQKENFFAGGFRFDPTA